MKLNSLSQEVFCALFWFFLFPSPFFCILLLLCLFLLAVSFVDSLAVEVMSLVPGNVTPCLESLREELLEKEQMMCGDFRDFQDLLDYLKSSGHSQCTTVWTKDSVAYRCRTCQVNDASAICERCYHEGDHQWHDFVMYNSDSGGCCDCGDKDAWKEEGFCTTHRLSNQKKGHVPFHLFEPARETVCWALRMLSIWVHKIWEERIKDPKASVEGEIQAAKLYIDWLQKVCSVDALRNLLSVFVTRKFIFDISFDVDMVQRVAKSPLEILLRTIQSMPEALTEGETTLFLQMLYNGWFKRQFTQELMRHYSDMVIDVAQKFHDYVHHADFIRDCKALDSTLDRVMVHLFNVPKIALIEEQHLLENFIFVFKRVLEICLVRGTATVDVKHEAIRQKVYLRPQGDLRLIVSHPHVAVYVLSERLDVFEMILQVVAYLQWMNPYSKNSLVDLENEDAWTFAIQLEMNTMAVVFQIIARCYSTADTEQSRKTVKQMLVSAGNCTVKSLHHYLSKKLTFTSMSLHIPLHRVLSAILSKLVLFTWDDDNEGFLSDLQIDYTEEEVLDLLDLPLRIAAWMVQIRAQEWEDVSEDFYRLELIYRGSFWHDQSWDMDVLLLQFCAVAKEKMEHAIVLRMADHFHLQDLVTSPATRDRMSRLSPSYIQDFLRLILLVVRDRRNTGMNELCRALSAIPLDHQKLSATLENVAQFHQPKVQEQGYYQLKPELWKEFDPLFAHFYLSELEEAQERAVHVGKLRHYWRIGLPHKAAPPYNRLTNLLHTQACHQLLWNVLNHVTFLVKKEKSATAGETLGVTALQMMEIAVRDRLQVQPPSAAPQPFGFHPNDILVNIKTRPGKFLVELSTWKPESSSMYDLLQELQSLNNAHRLADYAQHIIQLLHSFPTYFGAEQGHSKVYNPPQHQVQDDIAEHAWQRLKKERQAAILARMSAQQKAFLDQHDDQEDDEGQEGHHDASPTEGSRRGRLAEDSFERISGSAPALMPDHKGKFAIMESTLTVQECALCRTKCDSSDSPAGSIAFMQRYNMPRQLSNRAHEVKVWEAETFSKCNNTEQLITLIQPQKTVLEVKGCSLDYHPTEHVACCGHQMHQACFESYHSSLVQRHCLGNSYEGKGIIDLNNGEIWCPICRRLANVLLPVVEVSNLQRMLQVQVGGRKENHTWEQLWDPPANLSTAIDNFAVQTIRVRTRFSTVIEATHMSSCQVLWELLAGNIVHFEVETREETNEVGSSSSAPVQLRNEWGGEPAHLTALQELGKLAMVSNKSGEDRVRRIKLDNIKHLKEKLGLLCENKEQVDVPGSFNLISANVLPKLKEILQGLFSSNPLDNNHEDSKGDMKNQESSEHGRNSSASIGNGLRTDHVALHQIEESQEKALWRGPAPRPEFAGGRGMPNPNCQPLVVETPPKALSKHQPIQTSSVHHPSKIQHSEGYKYPKCNIIDGDLLEVDPFVILTHLLLSAFQGWLSRSQILCMVKFSYILSIIQTLIALSRLEIKTSLEAENVKLVTQSASLPFVQLTTCYELDGMHYDSGRKLMDAAYLEESLELQDIWDIIVISQVGVNKQVAAFKQHQQTSNGFRDIQPCLYKVPKGLYLMKLPLLYQELLWQSSQENCQSCGKVPDEAALCLICGNYFCCKMEYYYGESGECSRRHADKEYACIGIFLLMRSTEVLLMRGNRACNLPSLYLDQHGEEDYALQRNQKLYLSQLRLNKVRWLWLTAGFDFDTRILHTSYIREFFCTPWETHDQSTILASDATYYHEEGMKDQEGQEKQKGPRRL
ncbi:hypothetical protein CY35_03G035000 [Sphagnum magellanicum]|nr:hypothetical protein CY35_03G035000 [Sphagnum magellanicum]